MRLTEDGYCEVCGHKNSWGCGHTGRQRADARRHEKTKKHRTGACWHFDHSACDPKECKLAGTSVKGYAAFVKHQDALAFFARCESFHTAALLQKNRITGTISIYLHKLPPDCIDMRYSGNYIRLQHPDCYSDLSDGIYTPDGLNSATTSSDQVPLDKTEIEQAKAMALRAGIDIIPTNFLPTRFPVLCLRYRK